MKDVISDTINNYLRRECMLKEYKNPMDVNTLRVCGEMLQNVYDKAVENGVSRHEITIQKLGNVIVELGKVEKMMSM